MKTILLIFGMSVLVLSLGAQTTGIRGKVIDEESQLTLIGANVVFLQNEVFISGTSTDYDGGYEMDLAPGVYDVQISYIGFPSQQINGVVVNAGQVIPLDVAMEGSDLIFLKVIVCQVAIPMVDMDLPNHPWGESYETMMKSPHKEIPQLVLQYGGGGLVPIRN